LLRESQSNLNFGTDYEARPVRQSTSIKIIEHSETVEALLSPFQEQIGGDYAGYRGHVYRVLAYAMYLLGGDETHRRAIETALVYHDIGLGTDHDLAYLEPSIRRVIEDNAANGWGLDPELLRNLINWHHKVLPFLGKNADIVNTFRKADWVDATGGLIRHGLTRAEVDAVTAAIPEHGFRDTFNRPAGELAGGNTLKGLSRVLLRV
jgi:hypothetical protein